MAWEETPFAEKWAWCALRALKKDAISIVNCDGWLLGVGTSPVAGPITRCPSRRNLFVGKLITNVSRDYVVVQINLLLEFLNY